MQITLNTSNNSALKLAFAARDVRLHSQQSQDRQQNETSKISTNYTNRGKQLSKFKPFRDVTFKLFTAQTSDYAMSPL